MVEYWVGYFDLEDHALRHAFECLSRPADPVGEDYMLLGEAGMKNAYIRWHHWFVEQTQLHLVTCTHRELFPDEVKELALQAVKFAREQCE